MTAKLESGRTLAARYVLRRLLNRGAGGETWLALDQVGGRDVVLKITGPPQADDDDRDQRRRTQAALAETRHPALLVPGRLERDDGLDVAVMDYLPGGDLSRLRGRPWPFIVRRVAPVVEALQALHTAGFAHGDVKSANVLLDADGLPRLADFGSCRPLDSTDTSPGSPYAMSPQRYAGAPASVADDVYAVGAMLHELINGHPPFYPDISPERVRSETPPELVGRPAVPSQLRDLVTRCLAKQEADRPRDMQAVAQSLRECLALPAAEAAMTAPVAPGGELLPPAEPAPIRPQWQRDAGSGPSATELRRQGFRRGVLASAFVLAIAAVAFVFVVLPGLVGAPPQPAIVAPAAQQTSAGAPAPASVTPENLEQLAELKRQADALHEPVRARLAAIEKHDVAAWGAAGHARARDKLAAADAQMAARRYDAALAGLREAAQALDALEKQEPEVVRSLLHDGAAALDAGRSLDAKDRYAAVLRIDAANAQGQAGLKRAQVLDQVLQATAEGARLEQDGDARAAAAAYQRALALDPATRSAREGLARLQARAAGDAFSAAMARGLAALARQDYAAARAAFEAAGRLRPGAPEAADGLRQVEQASRTRDIAGTLARARAAEREERWTDAVSAYRDALKTDGSLAEGQQGVERCEPRAMLDAELQAFVDHPDRLYSADGRGAARSVLGRATQVAQPGPRLAGQVARLNQLLQQAETPIRVALASDNATDVQIYRVGKLGLFERRDVDLMPGRYTVVGTRSGYRDVRKELNLVPGASPPVLVIRCEEPI